MNGSRDSSALKKVTTLLKENYGELRKETITPENATYFATVNETAASKVNAQGANLPSSERKSEMIQSAGGANIYTRFGSSFESIDSVSDDRVQKALTKVAPASSATRTLESDLDITSSDERFVIVPKDFDEISLISQPINPVIKIISDTEGAPDASKHTKPAKLIERADSEYVAEMTKDKIEYELQKVSNNGLPSKPGPNCKYPTDFNSDKTDSQKTKMEKFANPCGPKNNYILRMISFYICVAIIWGILFAFLKHEVLPGGKLLLLILLMAGAFTLGDIFKRVGLPKILGMLVCGILFRNSGLFFDSKEAGVYTDVISTARQISLTCILIAAGLGLDAKSLKRLSVVVLELSFIPCIFEAIGVAIFCKLLLGLHWFWGMMIGFTMGAVSPAIVVPGLLKLQKKGYDSDNTISTIVIAAASFDDIVAISGYGIFFGLIFNQGDIFEKVIHGPIEFAGGLLIGVLWGLFSAWIPHKSDKHLVAKRVFMIGGGCLFLVLGSQMVGYDGAGPFACIVSAFVACMCWKWQGWSANHNPVADVFNSMWIVMEPALFALIGAEIDLSILRLDQVLNGSAVILGGLVFRTVACSVVLLTSTVNFKELVFINVAWLPKATVQAALGSLALDRAKASEPRVEDQIKNGEWTLMIAVLSILLTAPIGAVGISVLGKVLLKKDKTPIDSADSNRDRINNHV